ncbi:crossover junction endodeoxyribonuclease RuvC [Nitratidesulfovibrio liaohensis]|uniref:Crossover junction endodeoxyribonuclease RuvC n=2 Tax=Nitratidesulfovibrio liaohensis TaxID=2604158 RepID=A0ABY9R2I8_9BACT|nr:crossover junction endodeoxyribonuclease RuvC [Nitratidesulfovibrio liaohensis]WMW65521.1 crossover junction endodeoxyribonuclease RuvC [Nitratidesulfovibrio liaohensis]
MPPRKPASPQAATSFSPVSVTSGATSGATGGVTVIGIDPGSQCTGWGVVREASGVLTLVDCGAIRPKGDDFAARLGHLFRELHALVGRYAPDEAAIENVHAARNVATALKLGQARGVAVAACAAHGVVVADYQPTEIKKALVGTGGADKEQVSFMVARVLGAKGGWGLDTGDALAAAVCHLNARRLSRLAKLG